MAVPRETYRCFVFTAVLVCVSIIAPDAVFTAPVPRITAPYGLISGTVGLLNIEWPLSSQTPDAPEPVILQFDCSRTGDTWYDRHFRPDSPAVPIPSDTVTGPDSAIRTLTYTVPVYLPPYPESRTWLISIRINRNIIPGIGYINVGPRSPFSRTIQPVLVSGWYNVTDHNATTFAGFYDLECPPGQPQCWRWMSGKSRITFFNPRTQLKLLIEGWIPGFIQKEGIRIHINDRELSPVYRDAETLMMDETIPAEWLGDGDETVLTLETTEPFIPASDGQSTDTRELGIMFKTLCLDFATDMPSTIPLLDAVQQTRYDCHWKRMDHSSRLVFQNPHKNITFYLKGHIPDFVPGTGLHIRVNGALIDCFVPDGNEFSLYYRIPVETLGDVQDIAVTIDRVTPHALPLTDPVPPPAGLIVTRIWIN